jgi:hypothetical protein
LAATFNIIRFLLVLLLAFCGLTFLQTQAGHFVNYSFSPQIKEQHPDNKANGIDGAKVAVEKSKIKIRKKYREEHCGHDLVFIPSINLKLFAPYRCTPLPVTYNLSTFHNAYSLRGPPVVFA